MFKAGSSARESIVSYRRPRLSFPISHRFERIPVAVSLLNFRVPPLLSPFSLFCFFQIMSYLSCPWYPCRPLCRWVVVSTKIVEWCWLSSSGG